MDENRVDIVVDLETLGLSMDSPIIQIAAKVIAQPATMDKLQYHEFNCFIHLGSACENAVSDQGTLDWWAEQMKINPTAYWTAFGRVERRMETFGTDDPTGLEDISVYEAMRKFSNFYNNCTEDYSFHERHTARRPLIWGNGAVFDLGLLRNMYEKWNRVHPNKKVEVPWSFRDERDVRTIYDILDAPKRKFLEGEIPHIALFDARAEARRLEKCLYG